MIKAIIFDAGGVIVNYDVKKQIDRLVELFNPENKNEFMKVVNSIGTAMIKGEISERDFLSRIIKNEKVGSKTISKNMLAIDYEKNSTINKRVTSLIKKLRKRYKTIVISDTIESHANINKKRRLFDLFDDIILSNEVHLTKDSVPIFKLVLERKGLNPNECIFIDDVRKFLDVAKSIGIRGILFKNVKQLKEDLASFSIKID